jgi:phosphate-selective porin OprO/OprP
MVDTGVIDDVDDYTRYGLEAAAMFGDITAQGEYLFVNVDRDGAKSLEFPGWYIQAAWMVTGEERPYSRRKGAFGAIRPGSRRGAWELGARYSSLDLEDRDVTGGEEENLTLGVNWYANRHVRLMGNFIRAWAEPNDNGVDETVDIYQMRAQFVF